MTVRAPLTAALRLASVAALALAAADGRPTTIAAVSTVADHYTSGGGAIIHPNPTGPLTWEGHRQVDDRPGQSFTSRGGTLDRIRVKFGGDAMTNGTAYVRVYAHRGIYGTSSAPQHAALPPRTPTPGWLALSDGVVYISSRIEPPVFHDFPFTGANRIRLAPNTHYVWILDWQPNSAAYTNTIRVLGDYLVLKHAGNGYLDGAQPTNNGVWGPVSPRPKTNLDMHFEIYEAP